MAAKTNKNELDSFETNIGLPGNVIPGTIEELNKYLTLDITILEKLDMEKCAQLSLKLAQFSLYIQRELNREKAKVRQLKHDINNIIAPKIHQYGGAWDLQRASAILDDDAARELDEELLLTEQKCDHLEYVSSGIKTQSDALKTLQFAKRSSNV